MNPPPHALPPSRAMGTAVRDDIDLQRRFDAARLLAVGDLEVRAAAVVDARAATLAGDEDAAVAIRQALLDLASVAEELAEEF